MTAFLQQKLVLDLKLNFGGSVQNVVLSGKHLSRKDLVEADALNAEKKSEAKICKKHL